MFTISGNGATTRSPTPGGIWVAPYAKHFAIHNASFFVPNVADTLEGGQSIDAIVSIVSGILAIHSDIEIIVRFIPQYSLGWKHSIACARFIIEPDANGQPAWFRTEPSKCREIWYSEHEK